MDGLGAAGILFENAGLNVTAVFCAPGGDNDPVGDDIGGNLFDKVFEDSFLRCTQVFLHLFFVGISSGHSGIIS